MIVKIENKEQERYVLECAEKDGKVWIGGGEKPTDYLLSIKGGVCFPYFLGYEDVLCNKYGVTETHTFEQFKAQREPIKSDLEKENEELKKKLERIEDFAYIELTNTRYLSKTYINGYYEVKNNLKRFFPPKQTQVETKANDILKGLSQEEKDALKKLL